VKPVRMFAQTMEEIRRHAVAMYPEECCGFLVAPSSEASSGSSRHIRRVQPIENGFDGLRTRRFVIRSEDLLKFERSLESTDESVVGFYHSHPDHPARPSEYDRDHAWPWYTYVVISVTKGRAGDARAFELDEQSREFHVAPLEVVENGRPGSEAGASERVSTPGARRL